MRALITGITGQDGSYLAEFLLDKEYEVYGLARQTNLEKFDRLQSCKEKISLLEGDLTDQSSLDHAVRAAKPDEIYNLAGSSFVPDSWGQPVPSADVTGLGLLRLLEAVRKYQPHAKFLQASSSEVFGKVEQSPQNENTPFFPRTPYGASKAFAHHVTASYRESHNLFACSAIAFNHESPRRGLEFVTRKVTHQVARIKHGLATELLMGNLDARRDWGFAKDYVEGMWLMLQQSVADDYVLATGNTHSVRELLEIAFSAAGLDWQKYVKIDPKLARPREANPLCGDATKAHLQLGWKITTCFKQLIEMMVAADLALIQSSSAADTRSR